MPTINDIARQLGVSKSTVSKAFNDADDISETLRKKYWKPPLQWDIRETASEKTLRKNSASW